MSSEEICLELLSLAKKQCEEIEDRLPSDPINSLALLIETVRMVDILSLAPRLTNETAKDFPYQDIMKMGWNVATSHLLKPLNVQGVPMTVSNETTKSFASAIMHGLGLTIHIKRVVDMIRAGFVSVEKNASTYSFKKIGKGDGQFLDNLEFSYLEKLEEEIRSQYWYNEWSVKQGEHLEDIIHQPGNHLGLKDKNTFTNYHLQDLETEMLPLLRKWDSGYGTMMAYDSTLNLDNHFMALATEQVLIWRKDAGIHPDTKIGSIRGADITAIVICVVSFNLKHIEFANLAAKHYPEISIFQSITVWAIIEDCISEIAEYTKIKNNIVREAFNAIILKPEDVTLLKKNSTEFMPLLIDMGNGYMLRPISALRKNPFFSIISLLEHRDPNFRHKVSEHREKWQRDDLYALFQGTRYKRIEGNVKLRKGANVLTDIDAAIYDNITGELGLFQIKWQDFHFNDVKKLRSKVSNLTHELDEWAIKVTDWTNEYGTEGLKRLLRLKPTQRLIISSVYLFGISRNVARIAGYGFQIESNNLAITMWPQFVRNRFQTRPSDQVLSKIFNALKAEETKELKYTTLPVTFQIAEHIMNFENLWYLYDND